MKLNIYKNQKEISRTVETDAYDVMYGTVEDILALVDGANNLNDNGAILALIVKNLPIIKDLLKDIFIDSGLTDEELRNIKVKELVPLFKELMEYVKTSFSQKN